ncbi:MAG: hypothetical protein M3Q23_08700 [Actinomycetota bacterium]|nr:hypothetical protein [Actinomycetota bacterium]
MSSPQYWLIGQGVLDYIDRFAPDDVYDEFYDLIEVLMEFGPYPDDQPNLGILPLQDPDKPNAFTAPFGDGLLAYQVTLDQPAIKLVDVFWVGEGEGIDYAF